MGADRSPNHYFHEWQVWGVPGMVAGRTWDTGRAIASTIGEAIRTHRETDAAQIGHEALRAVSITEAAEVATINASSAVPPSIVEVA